MDLEAVNRRRHAGDAHEGVTGTIKSWHLVLLPDHAHGDDAFAPDFGQLAVEPEGATVESVAHDRPRSHNSIRNSPPKISTTPIPNAVNAAANSIARSMLIVSLRWGEGAVTRQALIPRWTRRVPCRQ